MSNSCSKFRFKVSRTLPQKGANCPRKRSMVQLLWVIVLLLSLVESAENTCPAQTGSKRTKFTEQSEPSLSSTAVTCYGACAAVSCPVDCSLCSFSSAQCILSSITDCNLCGW